jgi:hypothetical protein
MVSFCFLCRDQKKSTQMDRVVAEALVASANASDPAARDAAYQQLHQLAAREASSFLAALFVRPLQ